MELGSNTKFPSKETLAEQFLRFVLNDSERAFEARELLLALVNRNLFDGIGPQGCQGDQGLQGTPGQIFMAIDPATKVGKVSPDAKKYIEYFVCIIAAMAITLFFCALYSFWAGDVVTASGRMCGAFIAALIGDRFVNLVDKK